MTWIATLEDSVAANPDRDSASLRGPISAQKIGARRQLDDPSHSAKTIVQARPYLAML